MEMKRKYDWLQWLLKEESFCMTGADTFYAVVSVALFIAGGVAILFGMGDGLDTGNPASFLVAVFGAVLTTGSGMWGCTVLARAQRRAHLYVFLRTMGKAPGDDNAAP